MADTHVPNLPVRGNSKASRFWAGWRFKNGWPPGLICSVSLCRFFGV